MNTKVPKVGRRRRAAVIVQVVVALAMLIGFGALVIDVGMMYNTRADLQHAADAAALAGAAFYTTSDALAVRMGTQADASALISTEVRSLAQPISYEHFAYGQIPIALEDGDVAPGFFDFGNPTTLVNFGASPLTFNAVEVVVKRTSGSQNAQLASAFEHTHQQCVSDQYCHDQDNYAVEQIIKVHTLFDSSQDQRIHIFPGHHTAAWTAQRSCHQLCCFGVFCQQDHRADAFASVGDCLRFWQRHIDRTSIIAHYPG